jgi:hypothetical protein
MTCNTFRQLWCQALQVLVSFNIRYNSVASDGVSIPLFDEACMRMLHNVTSVMTDDDVVACSTATVAHAWWRMAHVMTWLKSTVTNPD